MHSIAQACSITIYDACYVALAAQLQLPLLTADNRLARQLENAPYAILTLNILFAITS